MNILFLSTTNPYPPDNGHSIRTYNILKYVAKYHNVYFVSFVKNKEDLKHTEPIKEMCKSADFFLIPDNVSRFRFYLSLLINMFSPLPYVVHKYYQKSMKQKIEEILRRNKIDIIHFDILPLASYRNKLEGIPTILTEHNVESLRTHSLLKNSRNFIFKSFMYLQYIKLKKFESRVCPNFDIVATVSENDLKILKKISPSANFVIIPNGVDTTYFAPNGQNPISNSIVWVGGMKGMYNKQAVDYFCSEIFPLLHAEVPDIKFTVVGKSPMKKLLKLAKLNKNVRLIGYADDVRPYINSAAAFIAPMKSGGGTKLKILTALSMAKPVVTTSMGAEGINARDNEHLVIADDPELFAKRTVELLKNPQLAARLGENGRKLMIEEYNWEIIGRRMNEVYTGIINSDIQKSLRFDEVI